MTDSKDALWSHRRLALIIANENYQSEAKINNAIKDSSVLKKSLEDVGFDVTCEKDINDDIMETIANFAKRINEGDFVFFYFIGYGYNKNNENYLLPTDDSRIVTEENVDEYGCKVTKALERLRRKNTSYSTIFILDCDFPRKLKDTATSSKGRGFSEVKPPFETFIQFAGNTNRSSLFLKHLLRNIAEENIPIKTVFERINDAVYKESNHQQKPLSMNGLQKCKQLYFKKAIIDQAIDRTTEVVLNESLNKIVEEQIKITAEKITDEIVMRQFLEEELNIIIEDELQRSAKALATDIFKNFMEIVNDYNIDIRRLKSEMEWLTVKSSRNKNIYNLQVLSRLGEIEESIRSLTKNRNSLIRFGYSQINGKAKTIKRKNRQSRKLKH